MRPAPRLPETNPLRLVLWHHFLSHRVHLHVRLDSGCWAIVNKRMIPRRHFLRTAVTASAAIPFFRATASGSTEAAKPIRLGFDNFALRAYGWKAPELIAYTANQGLDVLFISDLDAYESLEDPALRELKAKADAAGVALYAGGWSICPTSKSFKNKWGTAEEHLRTGIRVAAALGSPVYRVILGAAHDRATEGGIRARIADTVAVLKACKSQATDSGIRIAVENHAGDMHSWELADLIDEAGTDFVGANFDSGNAAWTMEHPLDALDTLGSRVICSSLRDDVLWRVPEGTAIQWTAIGEGQLDWKVFLTKWRKYCPTVPFMIETIGGFTRTFAHAKPDFWKNYDKREDRFTSFLALAEHGKARENYKAPDGADKKTADQAFQLGELERSLRYCREQLGLGMRKA